MMAKFKEFLTYIGIDISLVLAGLIGSLMMISKKTSYSFKSTLIGILTGTISANYLTPIVADILDLHGKSLFSIAFLLGYSGLRGVERIMDYFHKIPKKITSKNK
jgi:hypothetical protein